MSKSVDFGNKARYTETYLTREVICMAIEIVELRCPNCGACVSLETEVCEYCSSPVVIRTVNNIFPSSADQNNGANASGQQKISGASASTQFLKAKLYDRAIEFYESVIREDFNNPDAHFYAAIASLKGKRPFLASPSAIKKAEGYLQAATAIEPKGIYYYLWAYIRLDHHFKKFYKVSPDYKELCSKATKAGLSPTDIKELYDIMDVERPSEI